MDQRLLRHLGLLEQLVNVGLAKGSIDLEAMAAVYRAFHQPAEPLQPTPLHVRALLFALELLPAELGAQDTLWLSAEDVLPGPRGLCQRLGPTEWAVSGTFTELRRLALGCAVCIASSRALREALICEDTMRELYDGKSGDTAALRQVLVRIAFALRVDPNELAQASERVPGFITRLLNLAAYPWLLTLKTRGVSPLVHTLRAEALWRDLLQLLAGQQADDRPIAVWVGPVWVSDVVSPYVREVRPLLERWAQAQPGLASFAKLIAAGDEDAVYLCANLLSANEPAIDRERETAEQSVGIHALRDNSGLRLGKVIDTARLDASLVDPRVGDLAALGGHAPVVIVLEESDADIAYALRRLLCDVRAEFRSVRINATGLAAPGVEHFVARARVALSSSEPLVFAASSRASHGAPHLRALAIPDAAYLECVDTRAQSQEVHDTWYGDSFDFVFEQHRAQQWALVASLLRGDVDPAQVVQTFWLDAAEDQHYLASKRAHIADAIAEWRDLLGISAETSDATHPPERPPETPAPSGAPSRFRMRV